MTKINTQTQRGKSAAERFAEKVQRSGGCWLWTSAIGSRGYGIFWHSPERRSVFAHRFSYELEHGDCPSGALVLHSCDNPRCVNPAHLSLGTVRDNALDAKSKGRLAVGEKNGGGGKLSSEQVREIYALNGAVGCVQAARAYGVSPQTVKAIRRGRIWRSVTGHSMPEAV